MNLEKISDLFALKNKLAVITDGGGLASIDIAPMLADAGATVVIADKEGAAAQILADGIKLGGGEALSIATDIESEESIMTLFETVRARFGRLDILVNCAGLNANQPLVETSMQQFDAMASMNLRSTFMLMREGVRLMLASNRGGRIVNVTTMGALHPVLNGNQGYSSTRAAVTMLTRATALDYAKSGILANVVMPGAVVGKTRFHSSTQQTLAAGGMLSGPGVASDRFPLGRGNPRDIAAAVLYLVGPSGTYITGQSIILDGGFLTT